MATVMIIIVVGAVIYAIYYHLRYRVPRTGAMYPRYMKGPSTYRTSEELCNSKSFICPWCRLPRVFPVGYKAYSWPPERVFCQDCQKVIQSLIQSDFQPAFTDHFSYTQIQNDPRMWVICRDYDNGEVSQQKASDLVDELCIEQFEKQCLYTPTTRRVKSVRSISSYHDGYICGVCGEASNSCKCNTKYTYDLQRGKYPEALEPLLGQLQKLDLDFSIEKYYLLADWQNLKGIEQDVNTNRCSEKFAKKRIEDYIAVIQTDLQTLVDCMQTLKNGGVPSVPVRLADGSMMGSQPEQQVTYKKRPGSELMEQYMRKL